MHQHWTFLDVFRFPPTSPGPQYLYDWSFPYSNPHRPPLCPLALLTVALPLAKPTPLPLVPLDLNMGAFRNMSGTMK